MPAPKRVWNNIEVLKTHIVPSEYELFRKGGVLFVKNTSVPMCWFNDMKYLCQLYETSVRFVGKTYYPDCMGEYLASRRIQLLRTEKWEKKEATKEYYLRVFFHELAHHIQNVVRLRTHTREVPTEWYCERLAFEWAACDLSYYLWKEYAGHMKAYHASFRGYRSHEGREFLRDWVRRENKRRRSA